MGRSLLAALAAGDVDCVMDLNQVLGLGVEPKNLGAAQVLARSVVVFFTALVCVRLANKRFMAKLSAFDVILAFVLASTLSRAINGSAALLPSIAGGLGLALLHRGMSRLSRISRWFERLLKGKSCPLVKEGKLEDAKMREHQITESDLMEELRLNGGTDQLEEVRLATLERNGEISVIRQIEVPEGGGEAK